MTRVVEIRKLNARFSQIALAHDLISAALPPIRAELLVRLGGGAVLEVTLLLSCGMLVSLVLLRGQPQRFAVVATLKRDVQSRHQAANSWKEGLGRLTYRPIAKLKPEQGRPDPLVKARSQYVNGSRLSRGGRAASSKLRVENAGLFPRKVLIVVSKIVSQRAIIRTGV
ncbi:hypothetical protein [Bradyrhizobium sp. CCBAU 51627]|uniref:hypothetical protein n=1 Tax=Bradyrhizobium sp. CCBAU 51627 TaxID=1325088 RepID=UPI002306942A|nr:hypothetical protein [Bradyrhizobium sp. CCBAU 51627]